MSLLQRVCCNNIKKPIGSVYKFLNYGSYNHVLKLILIKMLRRSLRLVKNGQYLYSSQIHKLYTSTFPVLYSRFDKDLPNPSFGTPISKFYGPDTDILLEQLKKCDSLDRLLELMNMHLDVMNSKHIIVCLEYINNYIKKDKSKGQALIENSTFKSFSSRLMKAIRLFEPQEVITAYKTFCSLEVRSNTYIMQCILKMLGAHLNNMTLGQLTFLNFLLCRQRHNSLVDGLRLAIPLVLQVQIDQQLDSDNIKEVVNCLQLCSRSALRPATIQKVVDVIMEKSAHLSTEEAVTVIYSLLNIDTPIDGYIKLITVAFEILSENIETINPKPLSSIIRWCHNQHFYNFKFFFAVANLIASQKWDLESTYIAISHLHGLNFCSQNLIDHFAEVLCLESEQYHKNNLYSPLSCVEFLTATAYCPAKLDEAARALYSEENKLEMFWLKHPHLFFKFLSCLAMVGHFPQKHFPKILKEDNLFNIWSTCKKLGRGVEFDRYILSLFWSLEVYDEAKNFIIPSAILKKVIHSAYLKSTSGDYPLAKFIENGLGGSQFLQSGVCTEGGHVIDHIVAMRCGNYPVALQNIKSRNEKFVEGFKFVEDILLPEDAKIVAILVANEDDYFRDPEILKGWINLKVKSLEKRKYAVVVVNHAMWEDLPDREKIPYLMREIKQVAVDNCTQRSSFS